MTLPLSFDHLIGCQSEDPVTLALNLNLLLMVCGAIGVFTLLICDPTHADGFVFSA